MLAAYVIVAVVLLAYCVTLLRRAAREEARDS